ncbi:MAG: hypothetical protein JWO45_1611 [Spartobacteria bacterium]|nr:hypothetical protein [Spartobacteria bacterium]
MKSAIRLATALAVALTIMFSATYDADARGGGHSGHRGHSHSGGHSRCVGVCYGVRSTVTGQPRNTYVHGYVKKDGTVVQSYTRSQ